MQNLIDDVTRRLVSRLPETQSYYSLADLHDFQIPNFIITRIELELRKNLADSIVPPATDWANMKSANVNICWDNFIKAIHEQVRLPRSFARPVIEVAVADVLDLLIEPRSNMVEMIFGTATTLKFEEIRHAASYVTVYSYLPESLIKYMHRKQLQVISKEKAQQIVVLVDEKLTEKYNPLNWAQLIDPLFELLGEEIESEVFRRFFLDKNKTRWSDFFDKEENDISRAGFIELLTMPELDGIEKLNENNDGTADYLFRPTYGKPSVLVSETITEKEKAQPAEEELPIGKVRDWGLSTNEDELPRSSDFELENESSELEELESELYQTEENAEANLFDEKADEEIETLVDDEVSQNESPDSKVNQTEEKSEVDLFDEDEETESLVGNQDLQNESIESELNQTEEMSGVDLFDEKEDEVEESESLLDDKDSQIESLESELNQFVKKQKIDFFDDYDEEEETENDLKDEIKQKESSFKFEDVSEVEDSDDLPIYKLISSENPSEPKEKSISEQAKSNDDIPFWKRFVSHSEPENGLVIDLEKKEIDYTDEVLSHLKDMEEDFIRDIFGGETNAYIETIDELAQFKHWDEASNYIKKEIYRINQIDLYSDSALDFIERLQTYFTTKK